MCDVFSYIAQAAGIHNGHCDYRECRSGLGLNRSRCFTWKEAWVTLLSSKPFSSAWVRLSSRVITILWKMTHLTLLTPKGKEIIIKEVIWIDLIWCSADGKAPLLCFSSKLTFFPVYCQLQIRLLPKKWLRSQRPPCTSKCEWFVTRKPTKRKKSSELCNA